MSLRCAPALLAGLLMIGSVGCSPSVPVQPVSGTVTLAGKPVPEKTRVNFHPVDTTGQPASGLVDATGKYTLYTGSEGHEGALVGKYKVYVTPDSEATDYMEGGGTPSGVPGMSYGPFPAEWCQPAKTPKEVEVVSGDNQINIEIP